MPEDRAAPEYALTSTAWVGGRLRRGAWTEQLAVLEQGRNLVRFEPKDFAVRYVGGTVRLDLASWPLPFKPGPAAARRVHMNAFADQDVVCLATSAINGPFVFDLNVPGADDLLGDFLGEHGLTAKLSDKGRYAQALIGRLSGPYRLEPLAREEALSTLQSLAALSRKKLVQRLRGMLKERYGDAAPREDELAAMLREQVIALDLPAPALGDLASQTGLRHDALLEVLESLIDAGFVCRGRKERCPSCGYEDFYPLREFDERVRCHACQAHFLVRVASGSEEPHLAYQLDPLMARAMDQDLMPALLTLRHLYSPSGGASGAFWPGLEMAEQNDPDQKHDCDVLLAQDGNVTVCECKQSAGNLSLTQARSTIQLAERLGANTVFAAAEGDFPEDIRALAVPPRVRLLVRNQLVPQQ